MNVTRQNLSYIPVNMARYYPLGLGFKLLVEGLLILAYWLALALWDTGKLIVRYVLPVVLFCAFAGGVTYLFIELVVAISWVIV